MRRGTVRTPADVTAQIEALRVTAELAAGVPVAWATVAVALLREALAARGAGATQG